jgi:dimethylhistidine N-methyltransferase
MNIATRARISAEEEIVSPETREALVREVQKGLLAPPRSLSPWMFYDARGSHIFECITAIPEYYLTRTERGIFVRYAEEIVAAAHRDETQPLRLLELGAGTAAKTGILLQAAVRGRTQVVYTPVDVSREALEAARESIARVAPQVQIQPVVANYVTHPPQLETFHGTTLAVYIGSSIGNFSPQEERTILRNLRSQLQAGDSLLLGADMVKDEATLIAAYDDAAGVTAEFNLNILRRLNRELGADFHPACFEHRALWNPAESRMEMHLESKCEQDVWISEMQLGIHLAKGDTIHTENSYKFTPEAIGGLLKDADFELVRSWTDEREWFTVTLARVL